MLNIITNGEQHGIKGRNVILNLVSVDRLTNITICTASPKNLIVDETHPFNLFRREKGVMQIPENILLIILFLGKVMNHIYRLK